MAGGLIEVSMGRSWVAELPPSISASWVAAEATPMVTTMLLTYWCRSVSVDCFHAGFTLSVADLPGVSTR